MTDPTFAGDPGGITRVGWQVRGVAKPMTISVSLRSMELTVPGGTNPAWAIGPVATAVTADWQTYLIELARRTDGYGAGLVTAGLEFQAADHDNAKAM